MLAWLVPIGSIEEKKRKKKSKRVQNSVHEKGFKHLP